MHSDNDVRILSVVQGQTSCFTHGEPDFTHFNLTDYDVYFTVKGEKFYVPMQIAIKNHSEVGKYLMTAYLDGAMAKYYGMPLKSMGKKKSENRQALAQKILTLALKRLGG